MSNQDISQRIMLAFADIMAAEFDLKRLMLLHAISCMFSGTACLLLPHSFGAYSSYNHMTHEFIRLYGALSLGIGWLVWKTRDISDGRLKRAISESFALCYLLQAISMARAQTTNPHGHSAFHWLISISFACIGGLYLYIRFIKKIKTFDLPGNHEN
eukprot:gene5878-11872_t